MNAETYARRPARGRAGRYLIYDSTWPRRRSCAATTSRCSACRWRGVQRELPGVRTRILMKNICYAGALAALLDIDIGA